MDCESRGIEIDQEDPKGQNHDHSLLEKIRSLGLSQRHNIKSLSELVFINAIIAGLGFVTRVKIANTLGKADFGLFAYGFALAGYGGVIISFGLDRTLVRDLIHSPKRQGQLVASSILLRGTMFFAVTLTLLVWKFFSPPGSDLTWGVVLIVVGQSMTGLELKSVYDSWGAMSRHAIYNLMQRFLFFSAVWLTILFAPKTFSVCWIGIFTIAAVIFYISLQCNWAFKKIDFKGAEKATLRSTLVLAKVNFVIWLATLGALSFGVVNQLILKLYRGKEALGGYAAAWQIVSIAILFLTQVSRIGNPATARITKPNVIKRDKIRFLIHSSAVMFVVVLPISLVTTTWPEFILELIYKPEYTSAAGALRLMGLYLIVFSFAVVACQYLVSARLENLYFRNIIICGFVSIALSFIIIPELGDLGAILSLLIAHSLLTILNWIAVARNLNKVGSS